MTNLDLIPTKTLVDALCARFDHAVFSGVIERQTGQDLDIIRATKLVGCRYIGQALASSLVIKAHEENLARTIPADPTDL